MSLSFDDKELLEKLLSFTKTNRFDKPFPIEALSWPIALTGEDIVGIAQIVSRKKCTFVLHSLNHTINNKKKRPGIKKKSNDDGSSPHEGIVATIVSDAQRTCGSFFVHYCLFLFREGSELAKKQPKVSVPTPGSLLDFMEFKQLDVMRVSHIVMHEEVRRTEWWTWVWYPKTGWFLMTSDPRGIHSFSVPSFSIRCCNSLQTFPIVMRKLMSAQKL